jgi:hypothetical protein
VEEPLLSIIKFVGANGIRQSAVHTTEPMALEPSGFEVEMAIERLKK